MMLREVMSLVHEAIHVVASVARGSREEGGGERECEPKVLEYVNEPG
jgi:hypothetical protein